MLEWCTSCNSDKKHVRDCDIHERCTRGFVSGKVQSCERCGDFDDGRFAKRNLLYHVYPVAGNGAWQWNVDQLLPRLKLFTGVKLVAVVTDPASGRKRDPVGRNAPDRHRWLKGCDSFDAVRARFGPAAAGIEFLDLENDPTLREVVSLVPLLERLRAVAPPESATLYAQAKGTTRDPEHVARQWADAQYRVYCDHWPAVRAQLDRLPVTGAFKKLGPGWHPSQSHSDWHYSGSWFWFRTADLFARDWRTVDRFWSGIEPYPSQQFAARESGCLFHEDRVPRMNLYDRSYWTRVVDPALARWEEKWKS